MFNTIVPRLILPSATTITTTTITKTRTIRIPTSFHGRIRQRYLTNNATPASKIKVKSTTTTPTTSTNPTTPTTDRIKHARTRAGTGNMNPPEDGVAAAAGEVVPMMTRGPVSWAGLGLVAIVAASAVSYYQVERERRLENAMGKIVSSESGWSPNSEYFAKRQFKRTKFGWFPMEDAYGGAGKPAIGGEWSLVDLKGNLVTNRSFEGRWTLLYFGFARCPDICPSEMLKVGRVMDTLKEEYPELASKVTPVFVSIDPARDSLKVLEEYAKDFHPSFVFLTGTPKQVQDMAKKYRVYVSKADETEDGDYLVDHSIVVYFHDDTGDIADCFTQSMRPSDVVDKVIERMTFVQPY